MGRKRKPNQPTHLAGEAGHSPRRRGPRHQQKRAPRPPPPSSPSAEPMGALHPTSAARPARPHAATASVQTRGGPRRAARGVTPDTWVCKQVPSSRDDRELTLPRTPTAPSALTGTRGGRPHREPAATPRAAPPGPHAPGAPRLVPPPPWPPLALCTSAAPPHNSGRVEEDSDRAVRRREQRVRSRRGRG